MIKMNKPLSKLAASFVLLNSSIFIAADNPSDYLEDDAAYASVSDNQSRGWHWGLNSANACGNNVQDLSDCVEVVGDPIDPIDHGFGDFGGPDYGGGGDSGNHDDGSGSGGSSSGSVEPEQPSEREQCRKRAEDEYDYCEQIALENHFHESVYCQEMAHDPYANYEDLEYCEERMAYNFNYDLEQCASRNVDDLQFCDTYFSD